MATGNRTKTTKTLGLVLAVALMAATATAVPARAESEAMAFAQKLGDTAIASLTSPGLGDAQRIKRMHELLKDSFDVAAVSRFVLGPYVRGTTPAQFKEFEKLYTSYAAYNYAGLFKRYNGQKVEMKGERPVPGGSDVDVYGVIVQPDGPPVRLELRERKTGDTFKVVDFKVDHISMPLTHRRQFSAVIARHNGKVSALISDLRDADKRLRQNALPK